MSNAYTFKSLLQYNPADTISIIIQYIQLLNHFRIVIQVAKKLKIVVNESTSGLVASGKIREIKKYNPKLKTTPVKIKTICVEEFTLITNGRSVLGLLH